MHCSSDRHVGDFGGCGSDAGKYLDRGPHGTRLSGLQCKLPPLQGEGWGGDGVIAAPRNSTHPHPNLHLEREGTVQSHARDLRLTEGAMRALPL
jgi:hypothetical protein